MTIIGIDVAKYQLNVNWDKVKNSDIKFAFCKATQGINYIDPTFKYNWENIKRVGLIRGAYHFGNVDNDPIAEADFFVKALVDSGNVVRGDMPVLDIEKNSTKIGKPFTDWVLTFLERVELKIGIKPIVYTGGPYFNLQDGNPTPDTVSRLSRFPLWLAAYTNTPNKFIPDIWKNQGWTFWQSTGDVAPSGKQVLKLPGTNTIVDKNIFNGTIEELNSFAKNLCTSLTETFVDIYNKLA